MKIRTQEQLIDVLNRERTWRVVELQAFKKHLLKTKEGTPSGNSLSRAGVTLAYAHWEGFVKKTSKDYLEYVSSKRLKISQLNKNFLGVIVKGKLDLTSRSSKPRAYCHIVDEMISNPEKIIFLPYKDIIDTKSNLSSKVLKEILFSVAFDESQFETRYKFIDKKLLSNRNFVAHGEALELSPADGVEILDGVLSLIEIFKTQIENSLFTKSYMKS